MGRMRTIEYDEMLCMAIYQRIDDEGPISCRIVNNSICIPRINLGSCAERRKNYQLNNCPDRSSGHSNQPIPRETTATLVRLVAHTDEIPRALSSRSPSEIGNYDRSRSSTILTFADAPKSAILILPSNPNRRLSGLISR